MGIKKYEGVHNDAQYGMSQAAKLIRDAWVFGLLPEEVDGAGWTPGMLQNLYEKVHAEWAKYGHLPSRLPPELRERHHAIHERGMQEAKARGWNSELGEND